MYTRINPTSPHPTVVHSDHWQTESAFPNPPLSHLYRFSTSFSILGHFLSHSSILQLGDMPHNIPRDLEVPTFCLVESLIYPFLFCNSLCVQVKLVFKSNASGPSVVLIDFCHPATVSRQTCFCISSVYWFDKCFCNRAVCLIVIWPCINVSQQKYFAVHFIAN